MSADGEPAPKSSTSSGEVDAEPQGAPASGPAAPIVRGKRRTRLRDVTDEALKGTGHLMVADAATARIRALFRGGEIGTDRADLETVGDSFKRLARLFHSLTESRPQLFTLQFGNSVEVEIGPPDDEVARAAEALMRVEEEDDFDALPLRLQTAIIPETTLAALATVDLLEASEVDVVGAVLSYGTEVTDAYKTLMRHLADEMISMSLTFPNAHGEDFVIELESGQAEIYKQALTEVGNLETLKVSAVGTLTMADSSSKQVRLTLDSKTAKPPLLRNRRSITAAYTARAGRVIRDQNLWDKEVIAEFDVSRDRRGTTAHVRPPTFVLTGAAARYR